MKHNSSNRRSRGRNNRGRNGGNSRSQIFDSNGPEVRIRGTAHQICEKYQALAKDARSSGDIVLAESYLQHAEHYQRLILSWGPTQSEKKQQNDDKKSEAKSGNTPEEAGNTNDDLALPTSILGDEVKVKSEMETA